MWCSNCHAGNDDAILVDHCTQCGKTVALGFQVTSKCPFPRKPVRSIRAMDKRVDYVAPSKNDAGSEAGEIAEIIKEAQHRQ